MDRYTYDGNEKGNYNVFLGKKLVLEVFTGEDFVIELVQWLNKMLLMGFHPIN